MRRRRRFLPLLAAALLAILLWPLPGAPARAAEARARTIRAEVVALEQPIFYNRFGSFNPYGTIYALKRDVVPLPGGRHRIGGDGAEPESLCPGRVRLADRERPRPLVLRGNVGDTLEIDFTNLLTDAQPETSRCSWGGLADPLADGFERSYANVKPSGAGKTADGQKVDREEGGNWPLTRLASISVVGLPLDQERPGFLVDRTGRRTPLADAFDPRLSGIQGIAPGETVRYSYKLERPGVYLFLSHGAPSGGQGDGGSLTHGLFGAVVVEPRNSRWYRSQVSRGDLALAGPRPGSGAFIDMEAVRPAGGPAGAPGAPRAGDPVLNMLRPVPGERATFELVHGDLTAIVLECPPDLPDDALDDACLEPGKEKWPRRRQELKREKPAFREFVVIFHDELKTFYPDAFRELEANDPDDDFNALAGVRDGFAVNYGASGMGTILLANRKGIGPAKDCVECAYEEFFLTSWANGDPALLAEYEDDPSNVHHSYLNDRVVFHNLHAGPKETHVFHLHAHQWLAQQPGPDGRELGTYLDSQTIAPLQGFSYPVYYGGSGNRNLTVGDSIFHCHLYPHFAQGMWGLWRVHDVLEGGERKLPDGVAGPGTDPFAGPRAADAGTPIPAVVPLPHQALPPRPTYGVDGMPGYPFYLAGEAGRRPPQPPLDMALDEAGRPKDGGLPRHVVVAGERELGVQRGVKDGPPASPTELVRRSILAGDLTTDLKVATLRLLPDEGTPREQRAMAFHAGDPAGVRIETAAGRQVGPGEAATGGRFGRRGFRTGTPERVDDPGAVFWVNGNPPRRGAPYADPCGDAPERTYKVSAVGVDLVVNNAGWHDPQARINVLTDEIDNYVQRTPFGDAPRKVNENGSVKPFYFRAESGDCVVFEHTNRLPRKLRRDDFQVGTPTDTLGQHIHLVKFDVTSADGSANGFNYEDGTFAPDAVAERLEAAHRPGGGVIDRRPVATPLPVPRHDSENRPILTPHYQTTVQRWHADPLLTREGRRGGDRTLRSVFTHDHFGPSSIQQHGFYSALLVEPEGSEWYRPNGERMGRDERNMKAVGSQAIVKDAKDRERHPDHREFALSVADFALLYDPSGQSASTEARGHGLDGQIAFARNGDLPGPLLRKIEADRRHFRDNHGRPVDPPKRPEAISVDHHDPYLVNYRHEPLPLRIAEAERQGSAVRGREGVRWHQRPTTGNDAPGDLANVFSSWAHGDPATEIFQGYAGETARFRVIQGAQEVQHVFRVEGAAWRREINDDKSPLVDAQEIGISEHFEMALPAFDAVRRGLLARDQLYSFGTVDALWNGAWGFVRTFGSPDAPLRCPKGQPPYLPSGQFPPNNGEDGCRRVGDFLAPIGPPGARPRLGGPLPIAGDRAGAWVNKDDFVPNTFCPAGEARPEPSYELRAVAAADAQGGAPLAYDAARGLTDRAGLVYVLADPAREAARRRADGGLAPLVLRVRAGECLRLTLWNELPADPRRLDDRDSDANDGRGMLPRIVPFNSAELAPSRQAGVGPQLLGVDSALTGGRVLGINGGRETVLAQPGAQGLPGFPATNLVWYAGRAEPRACGRDSPEPRCRGAGPGAWYLDARPVERGLGVAGLVATADPIEHPSQGLIGAVVVEPEDARFFDPRTGEEIKGDPPVGLEVVVESAKHGGRFREFVVLYQDGLGLRARRQGGRATPVRDCPVCNDSYDLGEKGANYRSAPFWLRLDDPRGATPPAADPEKAEQANLNKKSFPANFLVAPGTLATTRPLGPVPGPIFRAEEGERLVFRVAEPAGRARQRVFTVLGHGYLDMGMPRFGSPGTSLVGPGKTHNIVIDKARKGYWIWRDGPSVMFSGGAWGVLEVRPRGAPVPPQAVAPPAAATPPRRAAAPASPGRRAAAAPDGAG